MLRRFWHHRAGGRLLRGLQAGVTGFLRLQQHHPVGTPALTQLNQVCRLTLKLVNYGIAAMILAAASIRDPTYVPTNYQTFLLTVFIMILHAIMSSLPTRWLAQINSGGSTFNFIALIVVIILIPAGTDREERGLPKFTPSREVWGTIYEGTSFPAGISVLMSFIGVI